MVGCIARFMSQVGMLLDLKYPWTKVLKTVIFCVLLIKIGIIVIVIITFFINNNNQKPTGTYLNIVPCRVTPMTFKANAPNTLIRLYIVRHR